MYKKLVAQTNYAGQYLYKIVLRRKLSEYTLSVNVMGVGTSSCGFCQVYQGQIFCDFLFTSLDNETHPK